MHAPAALFPSVACIRKINHSLTPNPLTGAGFVIPTYNMWPHYSPAGPHESCQCMVQRPICLFIVIMQQVNEVSSHKKGKIIPDLISVSGYDPAWPCRGKGGS